MRYQGSIVKGVGGLYHVRVDDLPSAEVFVCKARGKLRRDGVLMVGDRVCIAAAPTQEYVIESVFERRNELLRPPVANIDQAWIVFAVEQPSPSFHLLDKMIISVEHSGVEPVLIFNKSDFGALDLTRYRCSGYRVIFTSAVADEGIEELKDCARGKITVLTGPSGVGKSSLLNRLLGFEIAETGEVSRVANRGRHTTRHSQLFELEGGGILIDSPGYASIELAIDPSTLHQYYPEFEPYEGLCRFADCQHLTEPDCAVRSAALRDEFPHERYASYCRIRHEL